MNNTTRHQRHQRQTGLLVTSLLGACLAGQARAAEENKAQKPGSDSPSPATPSAAESVTNLNNWAEVSVGNIFLHGDTGAFQQRHQTRQETFGGLEDFHYQTILGSETYLELDGRALFDNHDYLGRLELVRPNLGFLRGGYKEFRTWYDNSAGFFPATESWYALFDEALALDRGEAWFEAGLRLPDYPAVTFKYAHQFRDGEKESTSWGFAHPGGGTDVRGLSPSFWDIDERRDIFQGDVNYAVGSTDLGLGLSYESSKNNNALKLRQWPDEISLARDITSREEVRTDLVSVHASTQTRLSKKVQFTTGYLFTSLDTDLGGSRIYGDDYDVGYNPALAQGLGFLDLAGGSQMNEHVANLNLSYRPVETVSLVPSVRIQKENLESESSFLQTGALLEPDAARLAESSRDFLAVTERIEARYTGLTNWVFYARGDWSEEEGNLEEQGGAGMGEPIRRDTDDTRWTQKYTAGVNWYPLRRLNIDSQYYHKERDNEYENDFDNTPNNDVADRYPAYLRRQDFRTDDANVRVTWRPLHNLTLVSRYDFQLSTLDTRPDSVSGLDGVQTADVTSHILAQNVTWLPWSRLYLQFGVNYVWSQTDTPADQDTPAVVDSDNGYWNLSSSAGFALDKKTDLQLHYFYYQTDNGEDLGSYGVPYGADAREHAVTCGLVRRLRDNIRLTLKYGFFDWDDETSGGHNDYSAHLVYSSLQCRF